MVGWIGGSSLDYCILSKSLHCLLFFLGSPLRGGLLHYLHTRPRELPRKSSTEPRSSPYVKKKPLIDELVFWTRKNCTSGGIIVVPTMLRGWIVLLVLPVLLVLLVLPVLPLLPVLHTMHILIGVPFFFGPLRGIL